MGLFRKKKDEIKEPIWKDERGSTPPSFNWFKFWSAVLFFISANVTMLLAFIHFVGMSRLLVISVLILGLPLFYVLTRILFYDKWPPSIYQNDPHERDGWSGE